jgi:DNA-binding transcriptional regulator YbjK
MTMTTRPTDPSGTRTRLLRATLAVVGRDGVGAVTNRAVAAEAGVALGSLTYHFASQDELLRESLMLFVDEEVERLRGLIAEIGAGGGDQAGAERITGVLRQAGVQANLAQFDIYVHAARDEGLREAVSRSYAAYEDVARATLVALGLPADDVYVAALVALIDGYELRRLTLGTEPDPPLAELLAGFAELAGAPAVSA